jgi:hypothetical protein
MTLTNALVIMLTSNTATLVMGYLWGRKVRAVIQIGEAVTTDPPKMKQSLPRWVHLITGALVIVGVSTVVLGVLVIGNTSRQDRLVTCVIDYANAASAAGRARGAANTDVFEQIDGVFKQFGEAATVDPVAARAKALAAIDSYNRSREDVKTAQRDNPLPEAPEDACADLLD